LLSFAAIVPWRTPFCWLFSDGSELIKDEQMEMMTFIVEAILGCDPVGVWCGDESDENLVDRGWPKLNQVKFI
jgi:hypothetical protein